MKIKLQLCLLAVCFLSSINLVFGQCTADNGTIAVTTDAATPGGFSVGDVIYLCEGDQWDIIASGYVLPPAETGEVAELMYALYDCTPTAATEPSDDNCYMNTFWTDDNFDDIHASSGVVVGAFGTGAYWFVPIAADDGDNNDDPNDKRHWDQNGDGCFHYDPNENQPVVYLNPITGVTSQGCNDGIVTITISGGKMEFAGGNYSISNSGSGNLSSTSAVEGGSVTISGLADGQNFSITVDDATNCPSIISGTYTAPDAGSNALVTYCESGPGGNLFNELSGSPDTGGEWTNPSAATVGSNQTFNYDPTGGDATGVYTYTVDVSGCAVSATVTVSEEASPDAGTSTSITVCETDAATNLFTLLGATTTGGDWSTPTATQLGDEVLSYNPGSDQPGDYTYTASGTICTTASATVTVTEEVVPDAGTDNPLAVCETGASVDLFDHLLGSPQTGGDWTNPSASTVGANEVFSYNPQGSDAAGTYTYSVSGVACFGTSTATVVVTETAEPDPGTNGTFQACESDAAQNLFTQLGGSPDVGGTWEFPVGTTVSGTETFNLDPATASSGTYTYELVGTGGCSNQTSEVVVTIETLPDAGTNGTITVCDNDAAVDLFSQLGGTPDAGGSWTNPSAAAHSGSYIPGTDPTGVYTYNVTGALCAGGSSATVTVSDVAAPDPGTAASYSTCEDGVNMDLFTQLGGTPDAGGTWTNPLGTAFGGTLDPATHSAGAYTYTVTATAPCVDQSAVVTVSIETLPESGSSSVDPICSTTQSTDLFSLLGGSPDAGGIWRNPSLAIEADGSYDQGDATGDYWYVVSGTVCTSKDSTLVEISNVDAISAGDDGALLICQSSAPQEMYLSLGSPDTANAEATFWTGPSGGAANPFFDPSTRDAGDYDFTFNVTAETPCADDQAVVTVTVEKIPSAGSDGSFVMCTNDPSISLFDQLTNSPDAGGSWTDPSGDPVNDTFDPSSMDAGDYTYTVAGTACADSSATVTLTVNDAPIVDAGEDVVIDIGESTVLNGSVSGADDFVWTPGDDLSSTTTLDPVASPAETQVYTLTGSTGSGCSASDEVTVSVKAEIEIPTGFTPNGDGKNDTWVIKNIEKFPAAEIKVYNRWGTLVYKGKGSDDSWDGRNLALKVTTGTYFFVIELNEGLGGGTVQASNPGPFSGTVTILK